MADINGNAVNKVEKLTMEEIADRLEGLKSSLDTIRRTASELIMGIDAQLQELKTEKEISRPLDKQAEQVQEFILAVTNTERSRFNIVGVKGMEGTTLMDSLLAMTDADKENVEIYLEGKGAETVHFGDEQSEEVEEFHIDYIYNTDTNVITDVKYEQEMDKKANEPIKDSDVVLKIMYQDSAEYEIDRITNMTQEQVLDLAYKLVAMDENSWDGNIQDFLEENGAEYVPIIVSSGRNKGLPEFFDIAVDLKEGAAFFEKDLSGMEYAASIVHRLEHGRTVFTPDERNLIVNYGYKLDNYEKTKELAETLAYRIENEPVNESLTVIDAQAEIDALPDSMIGLSEMHEYGYFANDMYPLTKESALELFDRDLPVYLLYVDGSETAAEDREQIAGHDGIFGIEKGENPAWLDWQNEREYRSMQAELAENSANKEAQLLYGSSDRYGIYQLKDNPELDQFRFEGTASLMERGITKDNFDAIVPENYDLIYAGELADIEGDTQNEKLGDVFLKFNTAHPEDFKGHSLSVSDIVVLHENGKNSAHFVDSFGFTVLPDFMHGLENGKEQDALGQSENSSVTQNDLKSEMETEIDTSVLQKDLNAGTEKADYPAVYRHTFSYADDHGELDEYRESRKLDKECSQAVVDAIRQNYDGKHLNKEAVKPVVEEYGSERLAFVLANTLQQLPWDGRFSRDNKAWAAEFHIPEDMVHGRDRNSEFIISSHPTVLDGFINVFRRDVLAREKEADIFIQKESQEMETDTLGQNDQKAGTEMPQNETADTLGQNENHSIIQNDLKLEAEQPEAQAEQDESEKSIETLKLADIGDGDEIIDLGDETEQVLADMKKYLEDSGDTLGHSDQKQEQTEPEKAEEKELVFQIADRYISIQETEGGYDYSIMGMDYKEIDGGVYDNPDVSIRDALNNIVEDLKENPFDNGARGNIGDNDELIPIDYDGLMEKVEEANRIVPEILQGNIVENFKEKTNELFNDICEMNPSEIEDAVKCHVQAKIDDYAIVAKVVGVAVSGSRCRGLERNGSDLDVVVELSTNEREDDLFNAFNNDDGMYIGDVKVDINPITPQKTGTLESYLPRVEEYLAGVREAREKEPKSIFYTKMYDEQRFYENTSGLDADALCRAYAECDKPFVEMGQYGKRISEADYAYIQQGDKLSFSLEFDADKDEITISDGEHFETKGLTETLFPQKTEPETEVTLTVAECGEFHNFGEFHENIATVDEAIVIWKQIPPERLNGIPAIGINIHTPGTEAYEDAVTDILTGKRFELDVLDYIPEIKSNPQAMEVIAELMAKLPDMKIEGDISEDLEAKIWEKRMSDLTPAEQLAVEIDRFIYNYDMNVYHDNKQTMTENVSKISEMIGQGDVEHLTEWLNEVVAMETAPKEMQQANELLEKLAEYKPLAKIEEMEEQNYNMVDNVLNNGVGEKARKEENKKTQDKPAEKMSLKARLAEKKAQVAGQGHDENSKNQQREM